MAYDRRTFAGGAVATTLTSGIDASTLTIPIAASTGWPSGSAGDFYIVIDRGQASEEKVRIDTRTTLTLTAITGGRGVDGTSAVTHATSATVEVCLSAVDLDEANAHIADTALDHHTQYLNTTRHDVTTRHAFGGALGTPAAGADVATAAAAGTGTVPARSDHVHKIGTGAINAAGMFAAGVVDAAAIATDAVGTAEIAADAVGTSEIAPAAVTATELASDAVTTAKILDANVTLAKLAAAAFTAYTPTVTGWAIGNGVLSFASEKKGRDVVVEGRVTAGSTTTFGAALNVTTPYTPTREAWGFGIINDNSTGTFAPVVVRVLTSGTITFYSLTSVSQMNNAGLLGSTPFAWAASDYVDFRIGFEATA